MPWDSVAGVSTIAYADRVATSPEGRFTLTAHSSDDGTAPQPPGPPVSTEGFAFKGHELQNGFRYRLMEHSPGSPEARVVWERWQVGRENSPHELHVSDDGWSVLRTHGFNPEVIAVAPSGRDAVRVRIHGPERTPVQCEAPVAGSHDWLALRMVGSTGGMFWTSNAWPYFFRDGGTDFFVWRTHWGQRLVLDLTHATLVPEDAADAARVHAMDAAEERGVSALLSELAERWEEVRALVAENGTSAGPETLDPLRDKLERVVAALHLVGVHRIQACLPFLQQWETVDALLYTTSSIAGRGASLEVQTFRPIAQHSQRLLGVSPLGFAAYRFLDFDEARRQVPGHLTDRRERLMALKRKMSARQVLEQVGAPDHLSRQSLSAEDGTRWTEHWDYDSQVEDRWVTFRIIWEARGSRARIVTLEEVAAPWLQSDARVRELLGL
ncbi:hypothetical protein [Corallococcus terminator]|uniref:hypothetical protein n=1 Tax=Corallococcus terminator TaxID=2316733 RepID=UPI000EA0BCD7|nr:hypothetical protein [Corallococcus terminator]